MKFFSGPTRPEMAQILRGGEKKGRRPAGQGAGRRSGGI
jgi:hypothetical protein